MSSNFEVKVGGCTFPSFKICILTGPKQSVSLHSYTQGLAKAQEIGLHNLKHVLQGGSQSIYENTDNSLHNVVYGLGKNRAHWPTVHLPLHFCYVMDDTAANSVNK